MTAIQYYPGYSQIQVRDNLIVQAIAFITQSFPMIVTTVNDHGYVKGMLVTFLINPIFGMQQLNYKIGQVLDLTLNTLTISIDSTLYTPFAYPIPLPDNYTQPVVIPYASGPQLPPKPLPYGNQTSFEGTIYNQGLA